MNIYLSKPFDRLASRQGLIDDRLCLSVDEISKGLIGSQLGAGLFKKRIAMPGQGKRGSWRVLFGFQHGNTIFFLYLFPKNSRESITDHELKALKHLAKYYFAMNTDTIRAALDCGELREVTCDEQSR